LELSIEICCGKRRTLSSDWTDALPFSPVARKDSARIVSKRVHPRTLDDFVAVKAQEIGKLQQTSTQIDQVRSICQWHAFEVPIYVQIQIAAVVSSDEEMPRTGAKVVGHINRLCATAHTVFVTGEVQPIVSEPAL